MTLAPWNAAPRALFPLVVAAVALSSSGCHRAQPPPTQAPRPTATPASSATPVPKVTAAAPAPTTPFPGADVPQRGATKSPLPDFEVRAVVTRSGIASWYNVPDRSLPERRAWRDEMTAASDSLPLNTYARVRRSDNGKSVIVRITDKGIHRAHTIIDVCREAAEELGMVESGTARVAVEVLALGMRAWSAPSPRRMPRRVSAETERARGDEAG